MMRDWLVIGLVAVALGGWWALCDWLLARARRYRQDHVAAIERLRRELAHYATIPPPDPPTRDCDPYREQQVSRYLQRKDW